MMQAMERPPLKVPLALDLAGVLVFAIEGALLALARGLDLLGVLVLAFSTALAGGIVRDLLIGAVPPQSIRDWRYAVVAFGGGILTFVFYQFAHVTSPWLTIIDAAGLSLFAVAGTEKALAYTIHPFIATLLGAITGSGGGIVADILLARVPRVLHTDIYATAALAGAIVLVALRPLQMPPTIAPLAGGIVCFVLRIVSVWQHWGLPSAAELR